MKTKIKTETRKTDFFMVNTIIASILAVFLIRLILSLLPSFQIDMGTWISWAGRLATLGPANFYSDATWTQYTPGYLYWLWLIGKIGWVSPLAIKIPLIFTDIATGALIWLILKKVDKKLANFAFFFYTLNPVLIFDGSVWGQIDGILSLAIFSSVYFLLEKKNYVISWLLAGLALLIKPQAIAIIPFLFLITLVRFKFFKLIISMFVGTATLIAGSYLFFPNNPLFGLVNLIQKMGDFYSYTSLFAYNIWAFVGMWKPDATTFLGISYFNWGAVLIGLALLTIFIKNIKNLDKNPEVYLMFGLSCLAFFLFPTRVHERYMVPAFAFLITYAGLKKQKSLFAITALASILYTINLYYPYTYYAEATNFLKNDLLQNFIGSFSGFIAFITLVIFIVLIFWDRLPVGRWIDNWIESISKLKADKRKVATAIYVFPKVKLTKGFLKSLLLIVMAFALVTRIFDLGSPPNEYFDEVYHAFTAKVILNPMESHKAWEWWNTPPEGFAYEWTHPPLAKLGMALGMIILGENSFGYRIPGALLGTICVFLIYLIAKELFKDELMAILSAAVFSLDGLALVMSRIAMNDSYLLFFTLLSILMFLRQKNFLSALSFGLALASKWSAIWAAPILFIIWLKRKNKFTPSIFWFAILPPVIYLLSYFQMFTTGHGLNIWWGMQEQMWWYHTGLKATHAYSSPWWSWPFLIRPIYLYTSDEINGFVSRIYAMGNPLVFWFGATSVLISFIYAFLERNKRLGLVVFSYLIFFAPWALSPRIMFLYHYLPSIPFLAIATAYVLRRNMKLVLPYFVLGTLLFIYFYPHWAGLRVPIWLDTNYYWVSSWR